MVSKDIGPVPGWTGSGAVRSADRGRTARIGSDAFAGFASDPGCLGGTADGGVKDRWTVAGGRPAPRGSVNCPPAPDPPPSGDPKSPDIGIGKLVDVSGV
jgi:hypothetical protein